MQNTGLFRYLNHTFSLRQALGWTGASLLLALLGAHFFRASEYGLVACCCGVLLLHCGHARWKRYAVSFFLLWGAVQWGSTAFFLAQARMQAGLPWFRAALIVWSVAGITCLGAIALYGSQSHAGKEDPLARLKGMVFFCSFWVVHSLASLFPVPLLLLERFFPRWGEAQIIPLAWYGVFVLTLLLDPKRSRRGRKLAWTFFSCVFFGQLILGLLGMEKLLMTGNLHIPVPGFIVFGPAFRGTPGMMLALALAAALLVGSAWCSMLCYFGPLDAAAAGSRPVRPLPPLLRRAARHGRLLVLALGAAVALTLRMAELPLEAALAASVLFVGASLLCMALLSRKYGGMEHCTAFCPMGIVVSTLGKLSPWRIRVAPEKCDNCGACENVCRYRAISATSRVQGKTDFGCSLCMDCIAVCKNKALALRAVGLPLSAATARSIFVLLLVVVHIVFLAFARV